MVMVLIQKYMVLTDQKILDKNTEADRKTDWWKETEN